MVLLGNSYLNAYNTLSDKCDRLSGFEGFPLQSMSR